MRIRTHTAFTNTSTPKHNRRRNSVRFVMLFSAFCSAITRIGAGSASLMSRVFFGVYTVVIIDDHTHYLFPLGSAPSPHMAHHPQPDSAQCHTEIWHPQIRHSKVTGFFGPAFFHSGESSGGCFLGVVTNSTTS